MDATEYLETKKRMTNKCNIECIDCPMGKTNNGEYVFCNYLEFKHPEKAIAIVDEWEKKHRIMTRKQKLEATITELFPEAKVSCHVVWWGRMLGNRRIDCTVTAHEDCANYWDEEYKEDK